VDTLGLIVAMGVPAAHVEARDDLIALWTSSLADRGTCLRKRWVDGEDRAAGLPAWVWSGQRTHKIALAGVESTGKGLPGVSQRWVVERTCAWLLPYRRLRGAYEVLTANSEAMMQISMIPLLLKRLA